MKPSRMLLLFFSIIWLSVFLIISCNNNDLIAKNQESGYTLPQDDFNYDKHWEEVLEYNKKGLPRSALKVVESIYKAAKENNQAAEYIKALIHKLKYLEIEEDTQFKIFRQLRNELQKSKFPVTPVIHSILAELYWNYYSRNRYRILQRSSTTGIRQDDMRTWDLKRIVKEIVNHYKKSLEHSERSKKTEIHVYDKIIEQGNTGRKYRPTLYDFLAHRAIDFFMHQESGLTQPAYQFTLNNIDYFKGAQQFSQMKITTSDPLAFNYFALTGLQQLIEFHLKDKDPSALVDVDLKRLRFLYRDVVISNKDMIYENALDQMIKTYKETPITAEICCELARLYSNLGDKFKPGISEKYKWYKKKAFDLCLATIKKYPNSTGAKNCQYLLDGINSIYLVSTLERSVIPGAPSTGLIAYKNLNKIYLKVIKTNRTEIKEKSKLQREKMIDFYVTKQPVYTWQVNLPDDGDLQTHSTEIKIDSLEPGEYTLLGSNGRTFNHLKHTVTYSFFTVSDIAYIHRQKNRGGLEFYLLGRKTGQPLDKGVAQLWYQEYDRSLKTHIIRRGPVFPADQNGFFEITKTTTTNNYFYLEFLLGKDKLFVDSQFYLYERKYPTKPVKNRTFFFTDRAIYRPGQTVYFKGIMLNVNAKDGERTRVLKNQPALVTFLDVNQQKLSQINLSTNNFGTFSGSFQIPLGRLNGTMSIRERNGRCYFSVEEYKRPKFKVTFEPLAQAYRLNDTVIVTGKAIAFAGYPIDNAQVKYRVVRQVFYPYRWCYWGYTPPTPQMEIINGLSKTNIKGEFKIKFEAIPDLTISEDHQPAYNYKIDAAITDINGETRTAKKGIPISNRVLIVSMNIPEELEREKKEYSFTLDSTNLSGDFVPAEGYVSFYKLKETERLCRKKLWLAPDRFTMSKEYYYDLFPHDNYADENVIHKWQKEKRVLYGSFDTGESRTFQLKGLKRWKTGKYVMEMTSEDRYGNLVKDIHYFTLYSKNEKNPPFKQVDWFTLTNNNLTPGEKAVVLIGSSLKKVNVIYEIEHRGEIICKKFLTLNNEQKKIEIPIKEKHRGNLGLHFTFIKYNRVFKNNKTIVVPWSNKKLDITFETFRNRLKPGEKEEWMIKIKKIPGSSGEPEEKVVAEMLATLYDASLDTFRMPTWDFNIFPYFSSYHQWYNNNYFKTVKSNPLMGPKRVSHFYQKKYDYLNWFGFYLQTYHLFKKSEVERGITGQAETEERITKVLAAPVASKLKKKNGDKESEVIGIGGGEDTKPTEDKLDAVTTRKNFQETAFFYPHLKTGKEGEVIIVFTIPEALTKWKMMGFAHTEDLKYGFVTNELVTQKELMVVPNTPRFLREKDTLDLSCKITNLTDKELTGNAKLMLFDAATKKPVDDDFENNMMDKSFRSQKGQSATVSWNIKIPDYIDAVLYRIMAQAGKYSDGEEDVLPVLKNRMLVTESMPLPVSSQQYKEFTFQKLISSKSTTLKHHKLTLEFTSNPVWYAVQALPYLMEYPHECMEQIFSRYYANSIAAYIVKSNPKIQSVFEIWKEAKDSNALLSNLEKNQELKAFLLQETPWVLNAQNETQRKRRIALLFDINKMASQLDQALLKLRDGQMASGAWPWFRGMRESRYITQHIICGLAHLHQLKVIQISKNNTMWTTLQEAVLYLDRKIGEDYQWLLNHNIKLNKNNLSHLQVHYLYARSYFQDIPMDDNIDEAFEYYKDQAQKYWMGFNIYSQGMIALSQWRYNHQKTALAIARSIKEHALYSEEMGMYWKNRNGYYWYQAPIETQALLIEMFDEILQDKQSVDQMRRWLLKQKQTQDWRTTKATSEACYALLLKGSDWLSESTLPEITLGKTTKIKIDPFKLDNVKIEAGTGYFKTSWSQKEINSDMGHVTLKNHNKVPAWGSLYWQYFEDLDKILPAKTPLQLKKQLFLEKPSATGPILHPIQNNSLNVGDRIKVRIELKVDRAMEYVHMKDMRASGFEPENVISKYKWQDGLGYYESTKDASTNFFIDYLPRGTYVFEYPLRVTHRGNFSNGITTIQCMYAPEFTSHSEGVRVRIEGKNLL